MQRQLYLKSKKNQQTLSSARKSKRGHWSTGIRDDKKSKTLLWTENIKGKCPNKPLTAAKSLWRKIKVKNQRAVNSEINACW